MLNSTWKKVKAEADKVGVAMDEHAFRCSDLSSQFCLFHDRTMTNSAFLEETEKHVTDIIEYLNTVGEAGAAEIAESSFLPVKSPFHTLCF